MGIENFKRWHWMAIGLVMGLILAAVRIWTMDVTTGLATLSQDSFEMSLYGRIRDNKLPITGITVYPPITTYDHLVLTPVYAKVLHYNKDKTTYYEPMIFKEAFVPYQPALRRRGRGQTNPYHVTSKQLNTEYLDKLAQEHPNAILAINPGDMTLDGIEALAQPYEKLAFRVDASKIRMELIDQFNINHPSSKIQIDLSGMPEMDLVAYAQEHPEITVRGFLDRVAKTRKEVTYSYAWWVEPKWVYILWGGGTFVLIGGIWPVVVSLITGAGLGFGFKKKPSVPKPQVVTASSVKEPAKPIEKPPEFYPVMRQKQH